MIALIRSWVVSGVAGLGLLAVCTVAVGAQKTDVVTLLNGDNITGEIKRLERGRLQYSTDDMGTLSIEWNKIEALTSVAHFEVELRSGLRYFGAFGEGAPNRTIIVTLAESDTVPMVSIIRITPIESTFWEGLSGFVDLGFSYAKANKEVAASGGGRVQFRGRKWGGTLEGSSYFQSQNEIEPTTRNDIAFSLERFFGVRGWSGGAFAGAEQNEELNLALRSTIGLAGSSRIRQTNSSLVRLAAGAVLNDERFSADSTSQGQDTTTTAISAEGVFQFEWAAFRFDTPELDLLVTVSAFPSITDFGRVRSDANLRIQYEVISDFFVGLTVFATLDSRPPTEDASKSDFATSLTVGWSF